MLSRPSQCYIDPNDSTRHYTLNYLVHKAPVIPSEGSGLFDTLGIKTGALVGGVGTRLAEPWAKVILHA